jgi:hypothetical protein
MTLYVRCGRPDEDWHLQRFQPQAALHMRNSTDDIMLEWHQTTATASSALSMLRYLTGLQRALRAAYFIHTIRLHQDDNTRTHIGTVRVLTLTLAWCVGVVRTPTTGDAPAARLLWGLWTEARLSAEQRTSMS